MWFRSICVKVCNYFGVFIGYGDFSGGFFNIEIFRKYLYVILIEKFGR